MRRRVNTGGTGETDKQRSQRYTQSVVETGQPPDDMKADFAESAVVEKMLVEHARNFHSLYLGSSLIVSGVTEEIIDGDAGYVSFCDLEDRGEPLRSVVVMDPYAAGRTTFAAPVGLEVNTDLDSRHADRQSPENDIVMSGQSEPMFYAANGSVARPELGKITARLVVMWPVRPSSWPMPLSIDEDGEPTAVHVSGINQPRGVRVTGGESVHWSVMVSHSVGSEGVSTHIEVGNGPACEIQDSD